MLLTPSATGTGGQAAGGGGMSVAKVFDILTRGESGVAQQFEAVMKQEVSSLFLLCLLHCSTMSGAPLAPPIHCRWRQWSTSLRMRGSTMCPSTDCPSAWAPTCVPCTPWS